MILNLMQINVEPLGSLKQDCLTFFSHAAVPNVTTGSELVFVLPSQSRGNDPPNFTLSFDVILAPPTYVTCQIDNTPVDVAVLSREVTAGEYIPGHTDSPVTNVTVTLRTRQAGNYACTVSVFRASGNDLNDVTSANVSVTS